MKTVELLAGVPQQGETRRAIIACNDYLRLGAGRTLAALAQGYRETQQNAAPTRSEWTIQKWAIQFNWQARAGAYDAELERQKNDAEAKRRTEILNTGFALHYERVLELKELATLLRDQIREQDTDGDYGNIWLADVKQIGKGDDAERVDIVRFNNAIFEQFRGLLDDIAKEVGERVAETKSKVTVDGELDINHGVDPEQYERAVAALADALRASVSQPGLSRPNAVAASEQAAVAGVSEPGG